MTTNPLTSTTSPLDARRGLHVSILRAADLPDCSNGGISGQVTRVTLVGDLVDYYDAAVLAPDEHAPAVRLIERAGMYGIAVPDRARPDRAGPMASGAFLYSSDSRFRALSAHLGCGGSAIPLHDRFETAEQYAALSSDY
ncbi:hypothetical protein Psed_6828 (plasmid) [Pseudonocardia dioxanivorans CB1190]|uniref:Uncharacterized protein n=1 Tax=Pseudonocardia dioxanivorans (strain ATCC 55486 / DSM 44775 / JCM 13855 / CB1190) TaxID=675635 RepID=F2L6K5_PSEUX|nr:hypothetical protein [Pseudonocardia dioxanivorans]AEA28899.1 hypothetical protein Psed_6828 [Pseudonocardia dioxanivorans CB1190]